jgi:hypothetical protein
MPSPPQITRNATATRVAYGEQKHRFVDAAHVADQESLDLAHFLRQQQRRHHRRHGEGGDHRAQQRISVSARHRPEYLAFHALHREQRQEGGDGDDHRKQDCFVDLHRGGEDAVQPVAQAGLAAGHGADRVMGQMAEDVLHHDDGAVDNDAEIDGADR